MFNFLKRKPQGPLKVSRHQLERRKRQLRLERVSLICRLKKINKALEEIEKITNRRKERL